MNNPILSIVIPAYNEALRIGNTLRSLEQYFSNEKNTKSTMALPTLLALSGLVMAAGVRFWNLGYNSAFNDEAIYIVIGKLGLFQWDWWSYNAKSWMAGLPYIYPPLAALASQSYGIVGARLLSVFVSLLILEEIYRLARYFYIYDKKEAHLAGLLAALFAGFSAVGLFVSRLATYDALAILLLLFSINLLAQAHIRGDGRDYFLSALAIFFAIATKIIIAAYLPLLFVLSLAYIKSARIRTLWLRYFVVPLGALLLGLAWINADGFATYAQSQIGREHISTITILSAFWDSTKYALMLGIPTILMGLWWGNRGRIILLVVAASMIPLIHVITHRLATLDKHSFFFIIFMSIIIGHGISALLHKKHLQLIGTAVLVTLSLFYVQAESKYLYIMEHSWKNTDAMLAVLAEKTEPGNKVLSEEGAATILALYDKTSPVNVTTFDWMQYQNMMGDEAYVQAVRDSYFDLIELDGQTESFDLIGKIRAEMKGSYTRIYYDAPFEIYARSF